MKSKIIKKEYNMLLVRTILTGLIGGMFWGTVWLVIYYLKFTEITPKSFIIRSWTTADWTNGWLGNGLSIIIMGLASIIIALIYHVILKRINSLWIGVLYGIILWFSFSYVVQPLFPNVKQVMDLKKETIVSMICLFSLYGTFIGYSISYDYWDTKAYMKKPKSH